MAQVSVCPAGSTYTTIRNAGQQLLLSHCDNYPKTMKSFVIPPSSENKFTECIDQPRSNLTKKEEGQLRGWMINQTGEKQEKTVSDLFVKMIKQTEPSPPILVMKNISIDDDHPSNTKVRTLLSELPGLDFQNLSTKGENDVTVLVKDSGIILVEVKGSTKHSNIESAESQLQRMNRFIQSIFKAITGDSTRTFPIIQLIAVPEESNASPATLTPDGSRFLFKDMCDDFNANWSTIILSDLMNSYALHPFTSSEFTSLTEILAGIWNVKAVRVPSTHGRMYGVVYDDSGASLAKQIEKLNSKVESAVLRPQSSTSKPLSNIIQTLPSDIFHSANDLKLFYLSPSQKELFDLCQVVGRGSAGSGKTLMLVFKVLQLKESSDFRDILILAPFPHTLRIRNHLLHNNHTVEMINQFPPPQDYTSSSQNTNNIYIMTLTDFFHVGRNMLMSYDMTKYHLFVDDFQSLNFWNVDVTTSFYDLGDFVDRWYESYRYNRLYFWVLMDVVQGRLWSGKDDAGKWSHFFFRTRKHNPRTYSIPIVHICHVMRSTVDITALTIEQRDDEINYWNAASHALPTPIIGHNISSHVPTHHKLQQHTDEKHVIPFIIERVREELLLVTRPPYSLPLSQVALLWGEDDDAYMNITRSFLMNEFHTSAVTIAQQLNTNNAQDIIMDTWKVVASFETTCVLCILTPGHGGFSYNTMTRPRTHLTVVDAATDCSPDLFEHMNIVHWTPCNNTYIKFTPQDHDDDDDETESENEGDTEANNANNNI